MTDRHQRTPTRIGLWLAVAASALAGLAAVALGFVGGQQEDLRQTQVLGSTDPSPPEQASAPSPPDTAPVVGIATDAADFYVAPSPLGSGTGATPGEAAGIKDLDRLIAEGGAGSVIELVATEGVFEIESALVISHGGTADGPVTIRGPIDGPRPVFQGNRSEPYTADGNPGKPLFRLEAGADHLEFAYLDCRRFGNGCFLITAPIADLKITGIFAENVRRFFENGGDGGAAATISGLEISDVTIAGFSKGAIRLGHDTNQVVISDVEGDSLAQDGDNFAIGVHLVDTVHDVVVQRVTMKNARDTTHDYWNGDGFATESGTHDLLFLETTSSGNSDAGYDIKGSNVELWSVAADDNKRNYRFHGQEITLHECIGIDPILRGGTGTQAQLQASGNASVVVTNCVFADDHPDTIVFDIDDEAMVLVTDGAFTHSSEATLVTVETSASIEIDTEPIENE